MPHDVNFTIGPESDPDKYRLLRQVGSGGEAELWQATVLVGDAEETVAVKILRDVHALDPQLWRERWDQQVELLRLVRHLGVVGVHESFIGARMHRPGEADDATRQQYLVMNWIVGVDFRQWVGSGGEHTEGLRHLMQVADVLDWLHHGGATPSRRPVIHGDLSPGNVIVNPNGQAVLVDFGLSKIVNGSPGASAGTQGFCAPEVTAGGEYGVAGDRYAFGALTYFVLTGQSPPATAAELRDGLRERVGQVFEGAEADKVAAIAADNPQERPAAGEWLRALRPHATTVVPQEKPLPPARAVPAAKPHPVASFSSTIASWRPRWLVSGGFALGLLTALLLYLILAPPQAVPAPDRYSEPQPTESYSNTSPETSEPSHDPTTPDDKSTPTSSHKDSGSTMTLWFD